jgi:hypothetical protein
MKMRKFRRIFVKSQMLKNLIKQKPFEKIPCVSNSYKTAIKIFEPYDNFHFQHIISNHMMNGETIRLDGAIRMQP